MTRGPALPVQNVAPLPTKIFSIFKTPTMACASITITTMQEPAGVLNLVTGRKTTEPSSLYRLGGNAAHATATAMHFPADAGSIFLTDELTNDRFLVDTGATLSIIPCSSNSTPSGPFSREQMENKSPLGVSSPNLSSTKANVHFQFFASSCCWSHPGH